MARPRQPPPSESQLAPGSTLPAGEVASALGVVPATGAVVPAAGAGAGVVADALVAAASAKIAAGFLRFLTKRRSGAQMFLRQALKQGHPEFEDAQITPLVGEEMQRELEFQRKAQERMERDLPKALRIADPDERKKAVQKILDREREFAHKRERAMVQRASAELERFHVKTESPFGAYWKLDPTVGQHTLDCLLMGEQFWPWEVLDHFHPPLHFGCPCSLLTHEEAVQRDLIPAGHVPNVKDARLRARQIQQLAGHLSEAVRPEERAHFVALALQESVAGPGDPQRCCYCEEDAVVSLLQESARHVPVCALHAPRARRTVEPHGETEISERWSLLLEVGELEPRLTEAAAAYVEREHPRGRAGKWIEKPRLPKPPKPPNLMEGRMLARIYDGFEHNGIRAEVTASQTTEEGKEVWGNFMYRPEGELGDHVVGTFEVTVFRDSDALVLYRNLVELHDDYQGRGFASAFFAHEEAEVRAAGVERVELTAALDVGGYAWARAGFEFQPEGHYGEGVGRLRAAAELWGLYGWPRGASSEELQPEVGEKRAKELRELRSHVGDAEWERFTDRFPTWDEIGSERSRREDGFIIDPDWFQYPHEIAAYGRDGVHWKSWDGHDMWLGKAFLLGAGWEGVKYLYERIEEAAGTNPCQVVQAVYEAHRAVGKMFDPPDTGVSDEDEQAFWDEVEAALAHVQEAAYSERLHPRDRSGKWVRRALHSWVGWPGDMRIHMANELAGAPTPSDAGGRGMREQARALLTEVRERGRTNPRKLYRGASKFAGHPGLPTTWTEDKAVARKWAGRDGRVLELAPGEAHGIKMSDYIGAGHDVREKQWLVLPSGEKADTGIPKGQRFGATPEMLASNHRIDAYNAGYRSVGRGDTGEESRYLRFRTRNLDAFNEGRAEALKGEKADPGVSSALSFAGGEATRPPTRIRIGKGGDVRRFPMQEVVAKDADGTEVGRLSFGYDPDRNILALARMDVNAERRRQGIGTELLNRALALHPGAEVDPGLLVSPEGKAWWDAMSAASGEKADPGGEPLTSLNPTGGMFVDYSPAARADAPLGGDLRTLDQTMEVAPDTPVTIYRGAPAHQQEIVPGDFVTTNPQLAKDYGERVLAKEVPASHVLDDASEPLGEEYIYRPPTGEKADPGSPLVRPEAVEQVYVLRGEPGQGSQRTRTTTPVESEEPITAAEIQAGDDLRMLPPKVEWPTWLTATKVTTSPGNVVTVTDRRGKEHTFGPNEQLVRVHTQRGMADALKIQAAESGFQSVHRYEQWTAERLRALTSRESGAKVAVRVRSETLPNLLDQGKLWNAHHGESVPGSDRSETYGASRAKLERRWFPIEQSETENPDAYPIYGYVTTDQEDLSKNERGTFQQPSHAFGDAKLTLKDEVRARTTITYSDSNYIAGNEPGAVASPIDDPSDLSVSYFQNLHGVEKPVFEYGDTERPLPAFSPEEEKRIANVGWGVSPADAEAMRDNKRREIARDELGWLPWLHGDFIETQIHGGVRIPEDVERIDFTGPADPAIKERLDALGVPYVEHNLPEAPPEGIDPRWWKVISPEERTRVRARVDADAQRERDIAFGEALVRGSTVNVEAFGERRRGTVVKANLRSVDVEISREDGSTYVSRFRRDSVHDSAFNVATAVRTPGDKSDPGDATPGAPADGLPPPKPGTVRLYLGTSSAGLQVAQQQGHFGRRDHHELANQIEAEYGLPHDAVWNHPYYDYVRSARAKDEHVYSTPDLENARYYANALNESTVDALKTAHRLLNQPLMDEINAEIDRTGVNTGRWKEHEGEFIDAWKAKHQELSPVVLGLDVPKSELPVPAHVRDRFTPEDYWDEIGDHLHEVPFEGQIPFGYVVGQVPEPPLIVGFRHVPDPNEKADPGDEGHGWDTQTWYHVTTPENAARAREEGLQPREQLDTTGTFVKSAVDPASVYLWPTRAAAEDWRDYVQKRGIEGLTEVLPVRSPEPSQLGPDHESFGALVLRFFLRERQGYKIRPGRLPTGEDEADYEQLLDSTGYYADGVGGPQRVTLRDWLDSRPDAAYRDAAHPQGAFWSASSPSEQTPEWAQEGKGEWTAAIGLLAEMPKQLRFALAEEFSKRGRGVQHYGPIHRDALLQEAYVERLHPRGRKGQWIDKPHFPELHVLVPSEPNDLIRGTPTKSKKGGRKGLNPTSGAKKNWEKIVREHQETPVIGQQALQQEYLRSLQTGSVHSQAEFMRPGGYTTPAAQPGKAFEEQHKRIMEAGALIDAEVTRQLKPDRAAVTAAKKRVDALKQRIKELDAREEEESYRVVGQWMKSDLPWQELRARHHAWEKEWKKRERRRDPEIMRQGQGIEEYWDHRYADPSSHYDDNNNWIEIPSRVQAIHEEKSTLTWGRGEGNLPEAQQAYNDANEQAYFARRRYTYETLQKLRSFGGEYEVAADRETTDLFGQAAVWLPSDWIAASNSHRTFLNADFSLERGHYQAASPTLDPSAPQSQIMISPSETTFGLRRGGATLLHELVHRAEHTRDGLRGAEWTFYTARVSERDGVPEAKKRLRDVFEHDGYREDEMTRTDRFTSPYSGKDYGFDMDSDYEILSMGIEDLVTGGKGIIEHDEEYRQFVLGMLALG